MIAAVYLRVSTTEQAEDGHGLDAQEDLCRTHIERQSWSLGRVYQDEGISGTKSAEERPAMSQALEEAGTGYQILVVAELSRLGRSIEVWSGILVGLASKGVTIASVREPLGEGKMFRLMTTFLIGIAAFERETLAERLTAGKEQKARKGGRPGGAPPLGYRAENGDLVLDPIQAQKVREIYRLRRQGLSFAAIEKRTGVPRTTVDRTLRREPFYYGRANWRGIESEGKHQPILGATD